MKQLKVRGTFRGPTGHDHHVRHFVREFHRQGRDFTLADSKVSPRVTVVNESFARRYFSGANPIGQRIRPDLSIDEAETPWREIVGVVADVKQVSLLDEPGPAFYVPYSQGMISTPHLVLRSVQATDAAPAAARRIIAAADPELALYDVRLLQDRLGASMASERFTTLLFTAFALLALLLSAVGLYGVLATASRSGLTSSASDSPWVQTPARSREPSWPEPWGLSAPGCL